LKEIAMKTSVSVRESSLLVAAATAAAACAVVLLPGQAHASDLGSNYEEPTSVTVHFSDLDLTKPKAVTTLYLRLRDASELVCGDDAQAIDLELRSELERCNQTAIENAVETVNRPLLTALYDRRFPDHPATELSSRNDDTQQVRVATAAS
jgi:UrcA family protein